MAAPISKLGMQFNAIYKSQLKNRLWLRLESWDMPCGDRIEIWLIILILELTISYLVFLLALAFWKRSLWMGLAVVILMATEKYFGAFKVIPANQENQLSFLRYWD